MPTPLSCFKIHFETLTPPPQYQDFLDSLKWKRCYGIEHWTFAPDGRMEKRQMSGNDVEIGEEGRWFRDGVDVDDDSVTAKLTGVHF